MVDARAVAVWAAHLRIFAGRAQVTVARLGKMARAKVLEGDPATDRYKLSIWTEVDVANRCAHVPFFWVFRFHLGSSALRRAAGRARVAPAALFFSKQVASASLIWIRVRGKGEFVWSGELSRMPSLCGCAEPSQLTIARRTSARRSIVRPIERRSCPGQ